MAQNKFTKAIQWVVVIVTAVGLVAGMLFIGPVAQAPVLESAPASQEVPVSTFNGPTEPPSAEGPSSPPSQKGPVSPPPEQ